SEPLAVGLDARTVQLDEPPRDREPDAETAPGAVERPVDLHEQVPQPGQHLRGDPDPRVPDTDADLVALRLDHQVDPPASLAVLRGVRQEVHEYLLESRRIGLDADRLGSKRHAETQAPRLDEGAHG